MIRGTFLLFFLISASASSPLLVSMFHDLQLRLAYSVRTVLRPTYLPMLKVMIDRMAYHKDEVAIEAFDNFISPYNQVYLGEDALPWFVDQLHSSVHVAEYLRIISTTMPKEWSTPSPVCNDL